MTNIPNRERYCAQAATQDVIFMNDIEAADRRNIKMMGANTREV